MKTLLLVLLAGAAQALEIKAPSPNSGAITPSTVTITGSGSKCFSVDDPTLVVDCNLERVGIGTAAPGTKLHMSSGTLTVDGTGAKIVARATNGTLTAESSAGTTNGGTLEFKGTASQLANISYNQSIGAGLEFGFAETVKHFMSATQFGLNTTSPASTLDVNGNAQFGSGATKSTFTATGFWEPYSRTRTQIDTLVPTKVGQVITCSNCATSGDLCISTGTLAAQWRRVGTASGCGTNE